MSLNANSLPLVKDYLNLARQIEPLLAKQDALKDQIRALGPGTYSLDNVGTVKVSKPSVPELKGTKFVLTEKITKLPPKEVATLQSKGIIKLENIFSRASASKVEATLL